MRDASPGGSEEHPVGGPPGPSDRPAMPGTSRVASARQRRTSGARPADHARRPLAEASRRIQELFQAAEAIVDEIEAEASLEADRYLGERLREADRRYEQRLEELRGVAATVIGQAEALRDEAQGAAAELARLVQELRVALHEPPWGAGVADGPETQPAAAPAPPPPPPPPTAPPPPTSTPPPTVGDDNGGEAASPELATVSEAALLCATQMAVAGESREAIQAELSSRFGLADPAAITDEILGPV